MAKREHRRTEDAEGAGTGAAAGALDETDATSRIAAARRIAAAEGEPTRASVLLELGTMRHLALHRENLAAAARASELEARIVGLFGKPDPELVHRVSDETLIEAIAGENAALAEMLRANLASGRPLPPALAGKLRR